MSRWRDEPGGPVLRGTFGRVIAQVNFTGSLWRGTTWTSRGSSSCTALNIREVIEWCEIEVGKW